MGEDIANDISDKQLYKEFIQPNNNNKQSDQKMGRGHEKAFLQRHADGQQTHEKILNIINH